MAPLQQVERVEPVNATGTQTTTEQREVGSDHNMTVAARVISLIGAIIMGLLAIRFLLSLLGANRSNGFADFIYSLSHPFVAPFFGLFSYTPQFGVARFEFETLVAILFYGVITAVLIRVVTIGRRTE